MPTFRIHLIDGRKIDVDATDPKAAAAAVRLPIAKIKRIREAEVTQ